MKRLLFTVFFFVFVFSIQTSIFSQPFSLVKDINAGSLNLCLGTRPQPLNLTDFNGSLFFTVNNLISGGVWKSDGTNAGTQRIKEISVSESIGELVKINNLFFFSIYNGNTSTQELWKSDGTEAGTVLVKTWPIFQISSLTPVNNLLYFTFYNGAGSELWKSDGTETGTQAVKAFYGISELVNYNGTLFFSAYFDVPFIRGLWKTDGTEAGTILVKEGMSCSGFYVANSTLFFIGSDAQVNYELWKSDGTESGTIMLKDIEPGFEGSNIRSFAISNNIVYFFTRTTTNGNALWRSDGTGPGTFMVKDLNDLGSPDHLTDVNGILFFQGYDDINGSELWKSDGSDAGTIMVKDIFPGANGSFPVSLFNFNGTLVFTANNEVFLNGFGPTDCNSLGELWKSDGTDAGTVLIKDIYKGPGGSGPIGFVAVNGNLFFRANDGIAGRELWKSDGTANGTALVKNIFTTNGSRPKSFSAMNGNVYFVAFNPDSGPAFGRGEEVYQTDGTLAGTGQSTWTFTLGGGYPKEIKAHNGELYMCSSDGRGHKLWKTNGLGLAQGTTILLKDINEPRNFTSFGPLLLFSAGDITNGYELWKTDGTSNGTALVKNINPGGDSNPANFININGTLYFTANDGTNGIELWKSDGTEGGTVLVKNINASGNSNPSFLTNINGILYFSADNGINGIELWKSDGTNAGTVLIKDINASGNGSSPASLTNINGVLYFSADDGVNGIEVWKSDGTNAGTVLIKDIYSGSASSNPALFTNLNGIALFAADDGVAGRELWGSNGTTVGTALIKDIQPGTIGSNPSVLTIVGSNVLFAADDGVRGREVWLSNGAEQGTRLMSEIEPGINGSDPTEIFEYGAKVLVAATNAMTGSEVWIADVPAGSPLPLELLEFKGSVVNNNGLLQWKTDNEENALSFVVERSVDGRNYSGIGSVSAINTPGIHYYDFTDVNITGLGINKIYYRLKQTDIDGRFTYSNIVILSIDNNRPVVILYPNPIKDKINMTINIARSEKLQWLLSDNNGRIIKRGNYNLSAGSTAVSLDVAGLSSGMYIVQLNATTLNQTIKVIKQ